MADHVFVGFGFGPIQGGLFVNEAFRSGNFRRIVVAEVDGKLVEGIRRSGGEYCVNIAGNSGIEVQRIGGIEIYSSTVEADRVKLLEALSEATEIVTSLPSVKFFESGGASSVAGLIAESFQARKAKNTLIYTAENNNHAAEILEEAIQKKLGGKLPAGVQVLNTVIGKMSQVVVGADAIQSLSVSPMAPGIERAFLVEAFNRILVTRCRLKGFRPGIAVFMEKEDLLPFEEAKLYGHNAIHALLAYLAALRGYRTMTELKNDAVLMQIGREAFLQESGWALIKKYEHLGDDLFTKNGYGEYAEDLLDRMTNPYLSDTVDRAARDPVRKLSYTDRIVGTMRLALEFGIEPVNMALGAAAGALVLATQAEANGLPKELSISDWRAMSDECMEKILHWLWKDADTRNEDVLIDLVKDAKKRLMQLI